MVTGMDRKDEIIKLQMDVINQMTQSNLSRIADDLWGLPELSQQASTPSARKGGGAEGVEAGKEGHCARQPQPEAEMQPKQQEPPPEKIGDLKKELEEYIGLNTVKREVESLINLVTVQNLRKQNGLPVNDLSLHMVFSGNPGTGKTMIARLMARIYKSLGILSKGQLVEVDRSGLVAGFVGQTAIKTGEVIQKAHEKGHMVFGEAAKLAKEAGAKRLWLTHYSPALADPQAAADFAWEYFPGAVAAHDGIRLELG